MRRGEPREAERGKEEGEREKRKGGRVASKGSTRSERYRDEEKDIDRKIEGKTWNEYYS